MIDPNKIKGAMTIVWDKQNKEYFVLCFEEYWFALSSLIGSSVVSYLEFKERYKLTLTDQRNEYSPPSFSIVSTLYESTDYLRSDRYVLINGIERMTCDGFDKEVIVSLPKTCDGPNSIKAHNWLWAQLKESSKRSPYKYKLKLYDCFGHLLKEY